MTKGKKDKTIIIEKLIEILKEQNMFTYGEFDMYFAKLCNKIFPTFPFCSDAPIITIDFGDKSFSKFF